MSTPQSENFWPGMADMLADAVVSALPDSFYDVKLTLTPSKIEHAASQSIDLVVADGLRLGFSTQIHEQLTARLGRAIEEALRRRGAPLETSEEDFRARRNAHLILPMTAHQKVEQLRNLNAAGISGSLIYDLRAIMGASD